MFSGGLRRENWEEMCLGSTFRNVLVLMETALPVILGNRSVLNCRQFCIFVRLDNDNSSFETT